MDEFSSHFHNLMIFKLQVNDRWKLKQIFFVNSRKGFEKFDLETQNVHSNVLSRYYETESAKYIFLRICFLKSNNIMYNVPLRDQYGRKWAD